MMARSVRPNRRMARGNQAIDGMVCRPVMSDPTALRNSLTRATAMPISEPMTRARA